MPNHLTPEQQTVVRIWNEGYSEGYNSKPMAPCVVGQVYWQAYEIGKQDRAEDEKIVALAGHDFDDLTTEEREMIYGNEKDRA